MRSERRSRYLGREIVDWLEANVSESNMRGELGCGGESSSTVALEIARRPMSSRCTFDIHLHPITSSFFRNEEQWPVRMAAVAVGQIWDWIGLARKERRLTDGAGGGDVIFSEILVTPGGQSKGCG